MKQFFFLFFHIFFILFLDDFYLGDFIGNSFFNSLMYIDIFKILSLKRYAFQISTYLSNRFTSKFSYWVFSLLLLLVLQNCYLNIWHHICYYLFIVYFCFDFVFFAVNFARFLLMHFFRRQLVSVLLCIRNGFAIINIMEM